MMKKTTRTLILSEFACFSLGEKPEKSKLNQYNSSDKRSGSSHFLWSVFSLFLVSCSLTETRQQEFGNIKKGMTKSQVLAVAGSPHWSDRKNDRDRWFYYINPHDKNTERVVYFKNNKVIGKGYRNQRLPKDDKLKFPKKNFTHPGSKNFIPSEQELRKLIKEEIKKKSKPVKFEKI